ncbi:MAG: YraN family protein [Sedimentisphaerales bacterium]|nr:YraN family protein [Sedimentisphaerales bacterium]
MLLNRRRLLSEQKYLGRWGERRCEKFLKGKGLKTLARNFSCRAGEIDLIMVDTDGGIVFVEVKARTQEDFGSPEQFVTYSKKSKLIRAARYFLATHKIEDRPFRFDVVGIVVGAKGPARIEHYANAFTP